VSALELRIPPVIQAILVAAGMWGASSLFPGLNAPLGVNTAIIVAFFIAGIMIATLGIFEFRKADTTVDPRFPDKSSQLVITGVYRISRNPMYLGLLLILLGWALYLMNFTAYLLLPVFVVGMNYLQIKPEERYLVQKFGEEFKNYTGKVRRWL
jgi:protein-S-isoprenylcysteine O-methyltransferase Ste14